MTTIPIYQVDAFADAVFGGNPAAVCFLDAWLDDQLMQNIAAENNLAETAFVAPSGGEIAHYDLRWFTPTQEVDLCGHATLATASVILSQRDPSRSNVTFATRSGILAVGRGDDHYELDLPSLPPLATSTPDGIDQVIGVAPTEFLKVQNENGMNLAIFDTADRIRSAEPDMDYIKGMAGDGLIISAPGDPSGDSTDNFDFVSRYFAPNAGIPEDSVTGSAHSVLVPYWAERLGRLTLSARQVSRRGGSLACRLDGDRVILGGTAVLYLEGTISV